MLCIPTDERLLEYGVLETIFDEVTPYQHVQVVRTRDFGKILVLDGFHSEYMYSVFTNNVPLAVRFATVAIGMRKAESPKYCRFDSHLH